MAPSIDDLVVDYFGRLFERIFSQPFEAAIDRSRKRNEVIRQVVTSADAASQSLTRFFLNEKLSPEQVTEILEGFARRRELLELEDIANPNVSPESVVNNLLTELPCPVTVEKAGRDAVYRVALHSIVQVLMLVGPVMAEWKRLNFSSTFELPRRIVNRLNQISDQLAVLGKAGKEAADERYDLTYRDYLLQRFYRVEVGTVKMTTNVGVDLRELFVMPKVRPRPLAKKGTPGEDTLIEALMDLAQAREVFARLATKGDRKEKKAKEKPGIAALALVKENKRCVIVGPPGSGKSTFLEWLQLQVASVEEPYVLAEQQAIPLLLRVRQLDPEDLPQDAALIERATASRDRATLMPEKWLERQMKAGRVLFMLDGLDETDVELRDERVLPWLLDLIDHYPDCSYLVSSRPVGYPAGLLRKYKFAECDLLNFEEPEIDEYARHWCTAVRLARNEPEEEARREGDREGREIIEGFKRNPYIRDLARNPLMLSAICLVNYFEHGRLPDDRAVLYKLRVEGLLHHWDQRRGIHSEYALEEKLRVCREVALAMQADDRAEYEADKVLEVFEQVLGDRERAERLLEHIRYRTGLLVERRADVFAFAHLTFQEYLAARAVHEGNRRGVTVEQLGSEHADGRWKEVIALYCGLAPAPAARAMLETLSAQKDTDELGSVLAEAYLSSGEELVANEPFRREVIARVARAPAHGRLALDRFLVAEVAPVANEQLGRIENEEGQRLCQAYRWLQKNTEHFDERVTLTRCREYASLTAFQLTELVYLLHLCASTATLDELAKDERVYAAPGPDFGRSRYATQAEIALLALGNRGTGVPDEALLKVLRVLARAPIGKDLVYFSVHRFFQRLVRTEHYPESPSTWSEFARLARRVASQGNKSYPESDRAERALIGWAKMLEDAIAKGKKKRVGTRAKPQRKATTKRPATSVKKKTNAPKKTAKRRAGKKAAGTKNGVTRKTKTKKKKGKT